MSAWYLVKLELGPTEEFPKGSPSRAYLLRLPLAQDGSVDEAAHAAAPRGAYVRRFWDNQPDGSGAVSRKGGAWEFVFPEEPDHCRHQLGETPIRAGNVVELTEPAGSSLPFRVVSVRPA